MPNHITNVVTFKGDENRIREVLENIKDEELGIGSLDFNKVIPMPESLNITSGSETDKGLKLYTEFIKVHFKGKERTKEELLNISEKSEADYLGSRKDIVKETFILGKKAFQNEIKYGYTTWYDWCIENWGTKWNSYGYEDSNSNSSDVDSSIRFLTAWSAPHPIVDKLAQMYSDIEIVHEWADEDIGNNLGRYSYENGERYEEYFPETEVECLEFAAKVMNIDLELDYGLYLNASETEYINIVRNADYELIELFGQPALFTNEMITDEDIPKGMYCYHIRHEDEDELVSIEKYTTVNHAGSVVTREPIDFGEQRYISFTGETAPNFMGETMSLYEFMKYDIQEDDIKAG